MDILPTWNTPISINQVSCYHIEDYNYVKRPIRFKRVAPYYLRRIIAMIIYGTKYYYCSIVYRQCLSRLRISHG